VNGVDAEGNVIINRKLRRAEVLRFFEKTPPCLVGIEACGGAHYWAREIAALGHDVRMVPPAYVKPFVKRGKTDAADAEAISEAVTRKSMRFVPIKAASGVDGAKNAGPSGQPEDSGDQCIARASVGAWYHRRRRSRKGCDVD
jgi:hypothetical protein